mmetsp:Transcript_24694/g.30839  ORF Transcript_24694/g.30839 Transcript_24694/m.30839 type:complete len:259 (-) Transcript_24694:21-797(-)
MESTDLQKPTVGVLALQGAFQEHGRIMESLGANVREVRIPEELEGVDGLIFPGGESTAMAIVGEDNKIFPSLKEFVAAGNPVWGTCAGMILLSDGAIAQKRGGQALVGGLNVTVCRNFFGSQVSSFEICLETCKIPEGNDEPYPGVFIRAPAILEVGDDVSILATVKANPHQSAKSQVDSLLEDASERESKEDSEAPSKKKRKISKSNDGKMEVIVAVKQGNVLATAFHPELTADVRWHEHFYNMVLEKKNNPSGIVG